MLRKISAAEVRQNMNRAAQIGTPFLFAVDYELKHGFFVENPLQQQQIMWRVGEITNCPPTNHKSTTSSGSYFESFPISYEHYQDMFSQLQAEIAHGNSFLANLTVQTPIRTDYTLEEIFHRSNSPYALVIPDELVCFSPETFVRIANGRISSNPMKGTIDAQIDDAEQKILADYKESAEHFTIVDLIRNDLSRVATEVRVEKLRYIERLHTSSGDILQVSSLIGGKLKPDATYKTDAQHCHVSVEASADASSGGSPCEIDTAMMGDQIFELLPAGSICGAPKQKTVDILRDIEKQPRGFYTGVFGYFDGQQLDSAVMIRYIEKCDGKLYFRSGGGITINSVCSDEYNEVIKKIYLPFA